MNDVGQQQGGQTLPPDVQPVQQPRLPRPLPPCQDSPSDGDRADSDGLYLYWQSLGELELIVGLRRKRSESALSSPVSEAVVRDLWTVGLTKLTRLLVA